MFIVCQWPLERGKSVWRIRCELNINEKKSQSVDGASQSQSMLRDTTLESSVPIIPAALLSVIIPTLQKLDIIL